MRKPSPNSPSDREIGRLQGQIKEREENYRDLFDGSVQGIVIRNLERRLFANEACVRMFGYASEEEFLALEDTSTLFAPHERKAAHARHLAKWRGASVPDGYEIECRRKDGSTIWVWGASRIVTWKGERALQATFTDISAQKKVEEELGRSERRYHDLIFGLPLGICIHRNLKPIFANHAFARIFGYASGEELCKLRSNMRMVAPEDRARLLGYRRARLAGKEAPWQYTFKGLRKDGTVIACSLMVKLIQWEGRPATQHCLVDVTEQERAAQQLMASEERFRDLTEGSVQGISIRGARRRLLVNEAFAKMFGYASAAQCMEEEVARPVCAPEEDERLEDIDMAVLEGRQGPTQYEFEAVRTDGSRIFLTAIARRVEWNGEPAVQTTCTDITERKLAEESLRASERRYRDLIEGSVQGINIRTLTERLLVNESLAKMLGYASTEELMAVTTPFTRTAPRDRDRVRRIFKSLLRRNQPPRQYEFEAFRGDGTPIWLSAISRRVEWEGRHAVQTTYTDISENKRAEAELRASEERYRELIEGSVQGISIRGAKRRLLVNESFAKMFGYASAAACMAEEVPRSVSTPKDRQRIVDIHNAVIEGRKSPIQFEFEAVHNDGSRIFLTAIARRIEWNGEPAVQTTCTDITERKLAEESLRASERRYRDLFEGSVQGINIRTLTERFLVNESLAKMLGYASPAELLIEPELFTRTAPHDRPRVRRIFESLLRREQPARKYEFEAIRKDGSTVWLSAISRRVKWEDRHAVQTTYTDISESRLAEEELRSSEERYRDLIEGSVQGILIRTEKPVLANEALAKMFGYDSVREVMRHKGHDLVAPAERERIAYYRAARLRGELVPSHYEVEGIKKDGTPIWLSVVARLIRWKGELAIQTTFTDITDRKRTEAELIEAKMQSIGMMARGIAREFNTIYTSLLGTISMGKMEAYAMGEDRIVEILSEAERTTGSAKKVIQDLMVLNRGGVPVKERITVEEMLKEVLPLSGVSGKVVPIRPTKIRINLNLASSLWAVNADKVQVNEALEVLISNGMHATPGGGVLSISAENAEYRNPNRALNLDAGKYVRITIRDQGVRIAPEHLKKIFDPYFSPTRDNAGIGMASAYSIIRQHEGTIKVVSNAATGNRFQVFLPAHLEEKPRRKGTPKRPRQRRSQQVE